MLHTKIHLNRTACPWPSSFTVQNCGLKHHSFIHSFILSAFNLSFIYVSVLHGSEQEILREEIASLQANKEKLRKRVSELEDELKKAREEMEKLKEKGTATDDPADVSYCVFIDVSRLQISSVC